MDTKEKILLGMLDLIREVGLEKASMGKLSRKIHASPGNIYFYFKGKTDLIDTLYEYCMTNLAEYLEQDRLTTVDEDTDVEVCKEFVRDIIKKQIDFYKKNPEMFHFIVISKSSFYLSDDIKKGRFRRNKPFYDFIELMVKRKIIKQLDVEYIAIFILGVMYELLKESIMFGNIEMNDEEAEKLIEIIWSGLEYRESK
jgi:AcrR family transcriptional regulator